MICEKCAREIETVLCGNCGQSVLKLGPYCYSCGQELKEECEAEEVDISDRILCSDGACIGVVENGVCKLCGKPYVPEA